MRPVPVAALSKALTDLERVNSGIVGSNPAEGMGVCPDFCCVMLFE